MRRPDAAAVVLLWLAVLTVAFHGCGRLGCGGLLARRTAGSVAAVVPARKMLLAATSSDDAAASSSTDHHHHHHHRHQHHRHEHHHVHRWNRHGIPPSAVGQGKEIDQRYGVEKRLVPTGPNPLHH
ncbi:protein FON2 SPARE1-like [Panicum miliaceum]|uniref:Protein FON2 SPARE1-like n=1 Tax=Panicum miliaceum TaxID=4540 RepID=A0A3L6SWL3_PANMI|nr:protein FON2 SPARE1-like [Panicum miliaceum]